MSLEHLGEERGSPAGRLHLLVEENAGQTRQAQMCCECW